MVEFITVKCHLVSFCYLILYSWRVKHGPRGKWRACLTPIINSTESGNWTIDRVYMDITCVILSLLILSPSPHHQSNLFHDILLLSGNIMISAIFITFFRQHFLCAYFFYFISSWKCKNIISMTLKTWNWWHFFTEQKWYTRETAEKSMHWFPKLIINLCKVFTIKKQNKITIFFPTKFIKLIELLCVKIQF